MIRKLTLAVCAVVVLGGCGAAEPTIETADQDANATAITVYKSPT